MSEREAFEQLLNAAVGLALTGDPSYGKAKAEVIDAWQGRARYAAPEAVGKIVAAAEFGTGRTVHWFNGAYPVGTMLYAAPVAGADDEVIGYLIDGKASRKPPHPPYSLYESVTFIREGMSLTETITDADVEGNDAKYHELLYAVAKNLPGESRHETALRYIRRAEEGTGGPAKCADAPTAKEGT